MKVIEGFASAKKALTRREPLGAAASTVEQTVRQIIDDVHKRGDASLFDLTAKIDGIKLSGLEIDRLKVKLAYQQVDKELVEALRVAAERIRRFHELQKSTIKSISDQRLGQLVRPLGRVGIYAPGGTAAYPSTVLMTAIPAKVAGVGETILVTPPKSDGVISGATLVAADIAGVDRIFSIGGAQAIAALAFGTESVPAVDKICGPGNIYVAAAKKMVYGMVGIDSIAGPSEVLVIADETANAAYCAADLLAQAEHDIMASVVMVTTSRQLAQDVLAELENQIEALKRKDIIVKALEGQGIIAIVDNINEAVELANSYAPEHLSLMVKEAGSYVENITNAGCIFLGANSPVAAGDYVAGPSHVLPTGGSARFSSPLNVLDFLKFTSLINLDKAALREIGPTIITIARAEGLDAHAQAVKQRL